MSLFMVVTKYESNDAAIGKSVAENFPDNHYEIGRGQWLVAYSGTTRELYDKLFPDNAESLPRIGGLVVFGISGYYGRSPLDMWEWMANKTK